MTHITIRSYNKKIRWLLAMLCICTLLPISCTLDASGKAKKEAEELQALLWVYILTVQYRNRCLEDPNTITAVQGNSYGPFTAAQCFAFSPASDSTVVTTTTPTNQTLSVSLWDPNFSSGPENEENFTITGGKSAWFLIRCLGSCTEFSVQF